MVWWRSSLRTCPTHLLSRCALQLEVLLSMPSDVLADALPGAGMPAWGALCSVWSAVHDCVLMLTRDHAPPSAEAGDTLGVQLPPAQQGVLPAGQPWQPLLGDLGLLAGMAPAARIGGASLDAMPSSARAAQPEANPPSQLVQRVSLKVRIALFQPTKSASL